MHMLIAVPVVVTVFVMRAERVHDGILVIGYPVYQTAFLKGLERAVKRDSIGVVGQALFYHTVAQRVRSILKDAQYLLPNLGPAKIVTAKCFFNIHVGREFKPIQGLLVSE